MDCQVQDMLPIKSPEIPPHDSWEKECGSFSNMVPPPPMPVPPPPGLSLPLKSKIPQSDDLKEHENPEKSMPWFFHPAGDCCVDRCPNKASLQCPGSFCNFHCDLDDCPRHACNQWQQDQMKKPRKKRAPRRTGKNAQESFEVSHGIKDDGLYGNNKEDDKDDSDEKDGSDLKARKSDKESKDDKYGRGDNDYEMKFMTPDTKSAADTIAASSSSSSKMISSPVEDTAKKDAYVSGLDSSPVEDTAKKDADVSGLDAYPKMKSQKVPWTKTAMPATAKCMPVPIDDPRHLKIMERQQRSRMI